MLLGLRFGGSLERVPSPAKTAAQMDVQLAQKGLQMFLNPAAILHIRQVALVK
jgi:hypothetical protein